MIRIVGSDEGPEAEAARAIRQMILNAWPWADSDPGTNIALIPNVQCYGQNPQDIDILLLADVSSEKASFSPFKTIIQSNGNSIDCDTVHVRSLCLVIEVKDHSPDRVRFSGQTVEVQYRNAFGAESWSSATKQSNEQKYSLKKYIEQNLNNVIPPYITNLIWLRNVQVDILPKGTHNLLPAVLTWTGLLNTMVSVSPDRVYREQKKYVFYASYQQNKGIINNVIELFSHRLTPTNLDRRRMDLIANAAIQPAWLENLGKEQVVFEGRGGTGKTMILLGLAWKLQNEQAARVLVLTYNNALVSDLRRLLALMGRVDDWGRPMIEVHTIYSILSRFFSAVGLIQQDDSDYYNNYEKYKKEALDFYKQNALTQDDYNEAIEASPSFLSWDYVFIDEGQDWPQDEKELLHTIYSPSRFVVADGCDQLVRRDEKCDWSATVNCKTTRIGLSKGLRMKSNLARFANSLAQSLALDSWSIENNPDSVGGRTVIVEGNPESLSGELKKLVSEAKRSGNAAIDLLTCVPPQLVISGHALVADWYAEWGYSVWDGTSETTRRTLPKSVEDMRIVQYDSCRGLEGWSVINFDIDRLYDYKLSWWEKPSDGYPSYADEDALAKRYAARWLMIPTTRAIDTLVLHIRSRSSYIGEKLWSLYNAYGDIIEWINV